jgi:hypothetical protein
MQHPYLLRLAGFEFDPGCCGPTSLLRRRRARTQDPWLDLICRRSKVPALRSVWKRRADLDLAALSTQATTSMASWNKDVLSVAENHPDWDATIRHWADQGTLVVRHKFNPFAPEPEADAPAATHTPANARPVRSLLCVVEGDAPDQLVPLTERSQLVAALASSWKDDIQLHAFTTDPTMDAATIFTTIEGLA